MKAAKKEHKTQIYKANYMTGEAFGELKEAMEDALLFERGKLEI